MQVSKFDTFTEECRMNKKHPAWLLPTGLFGVAIACWGNPTLAQSNPALEHQIQKITERPEFDHSRPGIKFIADNTGGVIYERSSPQKLTNGDEYDVILQTGS